MDRLTVIDRINRELRRQSEQRDSFFAIAKGRDPDTLHVIGLLDVDRLAKAVRDEP